MPYKRTTRSSNGGKIRSTYTQSISRSGKRSSKTSYSTSGGNTRITRTTNLNTGETKTYMTNKSGGWIDRKCISPPKVKFSKTKTKIKRYKSKPIKFSTMMWILVIFFIIAQISK